MEEKGDYERGGSEPAIIQSINETKCLEKN